MNYNRKTSKIIVTLILSLILLAMPLGSAYGLDTNLKLEKDLEYLGKMINFIEANYVYEVNEEDLIEGAMKGLFYNLDEYSNYYTPEEFKKLQEDLSGDFGGIGVHVIEKDGLITVVAPIEDTPASEAGLKPNDRIVEVNDEDITDLTIEEGAKLLRGEPGTEVKIGILRAGTSRLLNFTLTREIININPVTYEVLNEDIGYIKISEFNSNTLTNVNKALHELDMKEIKKLVIDLRNNPGGSLNEVVNVLRFFIPEGPIVHIKNADGTTNTYDSFLPKTKYEMAVLVNGGSASAAEIFAGAIQDTGVGTIVGTTTFGKGTVQDVIPLTNDGGIKLTVAEYLTPNMKSINKVGVKPDIEIEPNEEDFNEIMKSLSLIDKSRELTSGRVGLDVLGIEEVLKALGYSIEEADGVLDKGTIAEINKFQEANDLKISSIIDFKTQEALISATQDFMETHEADQQLQKAIEVLKE